MLKLIEAAFYTYWAWRVGTFLCSSYSLAERVTPTDTSFRAKSMVMTFFMAISMILHVIPTSWNPHLSFANTVVSIPAQLNTIYYIHTYLRPAVDNTQFTVLLCILTLFSVMETLYLLNRDWSSINPENGSG